MFRDSRGRFKNGPAHIITVELVAGLHPANNKTKVVTVLDMKESWKEHQDLVYSVAGEAAEAWATVEQLISSAAYGLVQKLLSREWALLRRKKQLE